MRTPEWSPWPFTTTLRADRALRQAARRGVGAAARRVGRADRRRRGRPARARRARGPTTRSRASSWNGFSRKSKAPIADDAHRGLDGAVARDHDDRHARAPASRMRCTSSMPSTSGIQMSTIASRGTLVREHARARRGRPRPRARRTPRPTARRAACAGSSPRRPPPGSCPPCAVPPSGPVRAQACPSDELRRPAAAPGTPGRSACRAAGCRARG